ncbi:Uncharacterised protein [Serratia fonticola]|uniref:Uncharacterized protein n=1 Tax=Serratia fonticola TaxID=47917 RepID=A0A4U9UJQ1_SERFO|nr:Uncharacterised protein [Serratia fonticola]
MIGTSAGAQNLSAFVCGQMGYARRVITRYTTSANFFNPLRFVRGGTLSISTGYWILPHNSCRWLLTWRKSS